MNPRNISEDASPVTIRFPAAAVLDGAQCDGAQCDGADADGDHRPKRIMFGGILVLVYLNPNMVSENQEHWIGSTAHFYGDVRVEGFDRRSAVSRSAMREIDQVNPEASHR